MMWVVAPQSTSRASGLLRCTFTSIIVDLKRKWLLRFFVRFRIFQSLRRLLYFISLIFFLCVDMFCHCEMSYATCYTTVPVCYYYCSYRSEQYALNDHTDNKGSPTGIPSCIPSSLVRSVSSEFRNATLNSLNFCSSHTIAELFTYDRRRSLAIECDGLRSSAIRCEPGFSEWNHWLR